MNFDARGNLIVADALKGLVSIDAGGAVKILTDSVDGERMIFVDDLAIARDGMIYFSDASTRHAYGSDCLKFTRVARRVGWCLIIRQRVRPASCWTSSISPMGWR